MLRKLSHLVVVFGLVALAAGPVLAAPLAASPVASIGTPAPAPAHPVRAVLSLLTAIGFVVGITIRADTASLANKFVQRAGAAAGDYKTGVANAGGEWEANTKNAEAAYEQGVQESINQKRFGKGVQGSGSKYQTNAVNLGSQRYAGGVSNAKDAWARGVQPSLDALKSLTLPPRGPRRSPANMERSAKVAVTLGALVTGK